MPRIQLEREVRFLKLYAAVSSFCLLLLCLAAFQQSPQQKQRFTEIDVERINIVEQDGSLRMVISNRERSPGPVHRGRPFAYPGGSRPGMIFYNDGGTENGGLIFGGRRNPDGTYEATHSLTFDQYEQDQIIALQYIDSNGERRQGLQILDRGERTTPEMVERYDAVQAMPGGRREIRRRRSTGGTFPSRSGCTWDAPGTGRPRSCWGTRRGARGCGPPSTRSASRGWNSWMRAGALPTASPTPSTRRRGELAGGCTGSFKRIGLTQSQRSQPRTNSVDSVDSVDSV